MKTTAANSAQIHLLPLRSERRGDALGPYRLVDTLLRQGFDVLWVEPFSTAGCEHSPGTFVIPSQLVAALSDHPKDNFLARLIVHLAGARQVEAESVEASGEISAYRLTRPRLAIYNDETHRDHFVRFWTWPARTLEKAGFIPDLLTTAPSGRAAGRNTTPS